MFLRLHLAWLLSAVPALCVDARGLTAQQLEVEGRECVVDDDCGLVPYLVCCTECPPAPPFEAAPRWIIDGMLIESETVCAEQTISCPEVTCAKAPEGCVAEAQCRSGRCVVHATGCGRPTS